MESQLGNKLTCLIPRSLTEEFFHIKGLLVFENKINSSADFVCEDTQGFALVVFSFEFCHILFGFIGFPEHENRRLITCPFQMVVADLAV
jgi:hypothetical protein